MEINLGAKIRELRKKKGLTQEELAVKLNVSSQAVSKWEIGTCYPDMAQIPVIANFFGVSLDELFCYDVAQRSAKIDEIITEHNKFFWNNRSKSEEILLNGLKEYPDNERLLTELMELYSSKGITENTDKAISLAMQLSADTKDVFLQCRAKSVLVSLYLRLDRYNDAKEIIESLPVMYPYMLCDKMRGASYSLKGEDRLKWAKEWKIIEIQELYISCEMEGAGYWETERYEDALVSFGQYRRVIEMFMRSDEINLDSYLWSGMQTHHWCAYLREAGCLVKLGRAEEAKAKIARAHNILIHSWTEKNGSADYFAKEPETYLAPFRKYYSEWGLDKIEPCPW